MAISKEERAKAEAGLLAEEQALKEKWCSLVGHRWDLPGVSPFNHDIMTCKVVCNRCNAHATVTVTIDAADAPPPVAAAASVPPAAVAAAKKP